MMGYPCLRVAGRFFASSDRGSGALIIKVPAARVKELIAAGLGAAFAPAGRPFREGVAISVAQQHLWQDLLEEAYLYAIAAVAHEEAGGRRPSAID